MRPPSLAPEFDLVVSCVRLEGDGRSQVTPSVDWMTVSTLAQRHGVTSFVHSALDGAMPMGPGRLLERRAAREAARNTRLRTALGELLERLAASHIDVIPLRCSRLASAPGELIELDLLVGRDDVAATCQLLTSRGFEAEVPLSPEQMRALASTRFVDRHGTVVSVEWDVADRGVAHGPSVDALWRRARPATLDGRPCSMLDHADRLLLGCVRGTIKRWQRLIWLREIADLMAEAPAAELDDALARADRCGARRALALGTSMAARLLGAPTSPRLADAARDPAVSALEQAALADLAAAARPLAGPADIARFHLLGRERVRDKVRYAVRRATSPGPDDVGPVRLDVLSRLLIPWRRAVSVGRQLLRRRSPVRGRHIARFIPTPAHIVDRMLALAGVRPTDRLLDIGCGDGAILIRAAQRVGCRGVGVDIDADLIAIARSRARAAGVDGLVEFRLGDARDADLSTPTVVCLYLSANLTLRPFLLRGLRPGARVVSFNFDMGDWLADEVDVVDETPWGSNTLYLWHITDVSLRESAA
jgi:hypothetical protein